MPHLFSSSSSVLTLRTESPIGNLIKTRIIPLIIGLRQHSLMPPLRFSHPSTNVTFNFDDFDGTDSLFDGVMTKFVYESICPRRLVSLMYFSTFIPRSRSSPWLDESCAIDAFTAQLPHNFKPALDLRTSLTLDEPCPVRRADMETRTAWTTSEREKASAAATVDSFSSLNTQVRFFQFLCLMLSPY